jgi:putative ABC transport system substrate-binding protein
MPQTFSPSQNMGNPVSQSQWKELQAAAQSVHIGALVLSQALSQTFKTAINQKLDALVIGNDTITQTNRRRLAELAIKHRLPAIYAAREFVVAGGLIVYAVSYADLYRRAATYVDKILRGAKPADLPFQQPTKFELVVNLKTARVLGLTVPPMLLAHADEVIE